ncbi:MAG: hypothetical protein ACTSU5_04800 [Promethearchaeota archaeon]
MSSLKIFFGAFEYLTNCVRESLARLEDEKLGSIFEVLIRARREKKDIIVDGQGRSLQSILLAEDCLEHNGFPLILPASNANLRPWKAGDVFIFNTGSGSGSPLTHAEAAKKDGLEVLGMTYNEEMEEKFPNALVLKASKKQSKIYAPLGTEFELTSAVIGTCIGYAVNEEPETSVQRFRESSKRIVNLFEETYTYFEDNLDKLIRFINLISVYVPKKNKNRIFFRGVGRDAIINRVAAIRYGHLAKGDSLDLRVIYEGHWDLRRPNDLAIVTSGSGSTSQTLQYALQSFISGMRVFGITSFEDSDLGKFCNRVDGCLVIPGRRNPFSMYNMVTPVRTNFHVCTGEETNYLPEFELNTYITFDSLLSQIAVNHGITEDDMKKSHRKKVLE